MHFSEVLQIVATDLQSQVGSKFPNLKILIFLLLPQNLATNQLLNSKILHPKKTRIACQCPYAKEMRWIGPKIPELELFSGMRSKFAIFDDVKIRHFLRSFDFIGMGPILGGSTPFFFCCLIIAYILGSNHELTLNPDFWVDLRGGWMRPPSR